MPVDLATAKVGEVVSLPDELASANVGDVVSLTPEQTGVIDPYKDLSSSELSELALADPEHFNLTSQFASHPLAKDPATVQKVADALVEHDKTKPGIEIGRVFESAGKLAVALGKNFWNYATLPGTAILETATTAPGLAKRFFQAATGTQPKFGTPEFYKQLQEDQMQAERVALEGKPVTKSTAGTEVSAQTFIRTLRSVAETPAKKVVEVAEKVSGEPLAVPLNIKPLSDLTPQERVNYLFDSMAREEQLERTARGMGESGILSGVHSTAEQLAKAGSPIDPNEVIELAAGDIPTFAAFGGLFGVGEGIASAAIKKTATAVLPKATLAKMVSIPGRLSEGAATVGGASIEGLARAAKAVASPVIEKLAVPVGKVAGAVSGFQHFGIPGIVGGVWAGAKAGAAVAKRAVSFGKSMEALAEAGKQIRTGEIVSPAAQLGRSLFTSAPGAAGDVAKGVMFDAGLYATAPTPEEAQGVGIGTLFGTIGAGRRIGGRALADQIIGPKLWGIDEKIAPTGKPMLLKAADKLAPDAAPVLEAMHQKALTEVKPGVAKRANAVRQFIKELVPDADFFLASSEAGLREALIKSGMDPKQAAVWASQLGFNSGMFTDGKGNVRRLVTARDIAAAPHEVSHALEYVLGDEANMRLDDWVYNDPKYSGNWDKLGKYYAYRFTDKAGRRLWNPAAHTWQEFLSGISGWGSLAATERIYRDVYNEIARATGSSPTEAQVRDLAAGRSHTLTTDEVNEVANRYLAREIRAENWDALFKHTGPSLIESPGLISKLAQVVADLQTAFGGDPLAGRVSEVGEMPLSRELITGLRTGVKGIRETGKPVIELPKIPRVGMPSATPATPEQQQQAADDAKRIASQASATAPEPGAMSPQQVLGVLAEAMGGGNAVSIEGRAAAPGDPSSALSSNRTVRRSIIEIWRNIPDSAKNLVRKIFYPTRVIKTAGETYQIEGWSPEVLAANAQKAATFLTGLDPAKLPALPVGIELDPATKTFTDASWHKLFSSIEDYAANQRAGRTGAGEPLVVPKEVTETGGFAPPVRGEVKPIPQDMADFINYLYNFRLPDTPIIRGEKVPLNVQAQRVSAATQLGRLVEPVTPRGVFGEYGKTEATRAKQLAKAEELGISGMQIMEVNPFRQSMELAAQQAGIEPPSLFEVIQHLNVEGIKAVEHAPEATPKIPANTLTLVAGFQPPKVEVESPRKDAWRVRFPSERGFVNTYWIDRVRGKPVGILEGGASAKEVSDEMRAEAIISMAQKANQAGIKTIRLPEGEDLSFEDRRMWDNLLSTDPRIRIRSDSSFSIEDRGNTPEAPLPISELKPGASPGFVEAYHGTTVHATPQDLIASVEEAPIHLGTYSAARQRIGREPGSIPLGLLAGGEKPVVHGVVVDASKIYSMSDPIAESYGTGGKETEGFKDDFESPEGISRLKSQGYTGFAYRNAGEAAGSTSLVVWDKNSLRPSQFQAPRVNTVEPDAGPELKAEQIRGGSVSRPAPIYQDAASQEGNPWVRRSADVTRSGEADNTNRTLLVQLSSNLINPESLAGAKDEATAYYDKLYSGARPGYARLQDFWEIPQWIGYASHFIPDADVYVVRDVATAKRFLNQANYGRVAFSALDTNKALIRELVKDYPGRVDVGGYVDPKTFSDLANVKWHDSMESLANDMGIPYSEGVDYRHFQGSDVIPRLTMSKGCRHKCAFCSVPKVVEETPSEVIKQQADAIARLGSKLVYLNDKTFGQASNYKLLAEVNKQIRAQNPDFQGFIIQTTAAQLKVIPTEWLKESGIKFVELGIESYNDPILKAMHKPATTKLIDEVTGKLRDNSIALIPNIIIGYPEETADTYARTLDFLRSNKDIISHANIYNLALYKDAELGKKITTLSDDDFNENVLEKSFHTNPEIHRQFAGDVYGLASQMLEGEPVKAQFQAPRELPENVTRIDDIPDTKEQLFRPVSMVPDFVDRVLKSSPEEWSKFRQEYKKTRPGVSAYSLELGLSARTPEDLNALRSTYETIRGMMREAMAAKDYGTASMLGTKQQTAREAYEAATGRNFEGEDMIPVLRRMYGQDYAPPMPDELPPVELVAGQFQPSDDPRAIRAAAVRDKKSGKVFVGSFHGDARTKAEDALGRLWMGGKEIEEGFVTNAGEFLLRDAAADRAAETKQLIETVTPGEAKSERFGIEHVKMEDLMKPGWGTAPTQFLPPSADYAGEQIKEASIRLPDGRVFGGLIHAFARRAAEDAGALSTSTFRLPGAPDKRPVQGDYEEGFTTTKNRFVGREEAQKIAEAAGQVKQAPAYEIGEEGTKELDAYSLSQYQPKTLVVRHGSTSMNKEDPAQDRIRGHLDIPLSKEGEAESARLADQLKGTGLQTVITSDLKRARQTASAIAAATDAKLIEDSGLRPWKFGPTIEGKRTSDMLPRIAELVNNPDERPPGGESFNEFKTRFLATVARIERDRPDEAKAIITHYRGTKLLDAWKAAGAGADLKIDKDVFNEFDTSKKPGTFDTLQLAAQAQPRRREPEGDWRLKTPTGRGGAYAHSKAWITPEGEAIQLGSKLHYEWMNENPDVRKRYGIPEAKDVAEGVEAHRKALRAGFARINYAVSTGALTVEARNRDWTKLVPAIRQFAEVNADKIDSMTVHLFNDSVNRVVNADTQPLFRFSDAEKMNHLPLISEPSETIEMSAQASAAQAQPPRMFPSQTFDKELEKIRSGSSGGQTFSTSGEIWEPAEKKVDLVSLASINLPLGKLSREAVEAALEKFSDLLDEANLAAGMFAFSKAGKPTVSVDLNAVVPSKYRENTLQFAKDNDQVSIWDVEHSKEVPAGGKGDTRLQSIGEILDALNSLTKGKPVDVDQIIKENRPSEAAGEELLLPEIGTKKPLSSSQMANMTKADIAAHYPESVIPRARTDAIPSEITASPLYAKAKDEKSAIASFGRKLIEFAKEWQDKPQFQSGLRWYSEFVPKLKKVFGKDAPIMAELLAGTSPQQPPDSNFAMALDALEGMKSGRFDKHVKKFEDGLDKLKDGSWRQWINREVKAGNVPEAPETPTAETFVNQWVKKYNLLPRQSNGKLYAISSDAVLKILARRWLENTSGLKTQNFVKNLLGLGHEATIDLWADRTMRRIGYSGFKDRWRILPKNAAPVSDADFLFSQKAFRYAADELGIEPDALQGALWFAEKQLWADSGWGRLDLGDFRKEIEKTELLRQGIQQRTATQAAVKKAKPVEQPELMIEPRPLR